MRFGQLRFIIKSTHFNQTYKPFKLNQTRHFYIQSMADKGVGPTEPGSYLDELTGEMVSKSELKRRAKQREKDAKKAAEKVSLIDNYVFFDWLTDFVL